MAEEKEYVTIEAAGRELRVSSPSKLYFPEPGFTKLDLIGYYVECAEAVLVHLYGVVDPMQYRQLRAVDPIVVDALAAR
ncbi:MAG: hypothetical protein ABSH36_08545, partial [Solirubrobacteraceae bacterium]